MGVPHNPLNFLGVQLWLTHIFLGIKNAFIFFHVFLGGFKGQSPDTSQVEFSSHDCEDANDELLLYK